MNKEEKSIGEVDFSNFTLDGRVVSVKKIKDINKYVSEISLENYKLKSQLETSNNKLKEIKTQLESALERVPNNFADYSANDFKEKVTDILSTIDGNTNE